MVVVNMYPLEHTNMATYDNMRAKRNAVNSS